MSTNVIIEIQKYEEGLDNELHELVKWTLELDPADRDGYLHFSLGQRKIQLRLQRRSAHNEEKYELCAAINRHLKKIVTMLKK